jgi:hypothetical protein
MSVIAIFRQQTIRPLHLCSILTIFLGCTVMFARLRAELKAITEWCRHTQIFRTQTEKEAVIIREMRRREITRQLIEIVTKN